MAAAAILNFGKLSITPDWIKYLHQILCEDASRPCRDDHVTKGRNRKLIPVTSSSERLKHKCVDLSYYNRYLNQIGTDLKFHTVYTPEWSNSQPQNTRCRLPPFWIFRLCEFKKCQWRRTGWRYMHEILRNNALDISLYNSLYGWSRLVR